jgi:hypothetical protein
MHLPLIAILPRIERIPATAFSHGTKSAEGLCIHRHDDRVSVPENQTGV